MVKYNLYLLVLILLSGITTVYLSAEETWQKEFTKEGITVYTRPVEGSQLKEFKGEATINAPVEVILNVLADIESQTKWRPDCIDAKLIQKKGNTAISYIETKAPWPVSNRDVIVQTIISGTKDRIILNFIALDNPDIMPLKKGVVRMTNLTGIWILIRNDNETHVAYQAKIDPAGSIPVWLANKTSIDQPFKTLLGLKEMVKDPKYGNK